MNLKLVKKTGLTGTSSLERTSGDPNQGDLSGGPAQFIGTVDFIANKFILQIIMVLICDILIFPTVVTINCMTAIGKIYSCNSIKVRRLGDLTAGVTAYAAGDSSTILLKKDLE